MKAGFEQRIEEAYSSVLKAVRRDAPRFPLSHAVGIVLGSGLGDFASKIEGVELPYSAVKGFPATTVAGHRGLFKLGERILLMAGRFHSYEGWDPDDVVLPVFLLKRLGASRLIVTNAAGAVNRRFSPGDLVIIKDHLNLMGKNPLTGPNPDNLGPRFPDMSDTYNPGLRAMVHEVSPFPVKEGVYAALNGPTYETPAEIRMLETLGADMVGMSTVPEVIAARFLGMEVLGISCITNMAAGILDQPLNHDEVIETGRRAASDFTGLLLAVLERLFRE